MFNRFKVLALLGLLVFSSVLALPAQAAGPNEFYQGSDLLRELMDIDIGSEDSLYSDPQYLDLVEKFNSLNKNIDKTAEDLVNVLDSYIEFADQMQAINDPRFEDYKMDPQELEQLKKMTEEIKSELLYGEQSFSEMIYSQILAMENNPIEDSVGFNDYSLSGYVLNASGRVDRDFAVSGQVVTLLDFSSQSDYEKTTSVIWQQIAGPQVELFAAESHWSNDRSFIMPEFTNTDADFVAFDIMVTQEGQTSASTVYVYLDKTGEKSIRKMYNDILWRDADEVGLAYWLNEYQNGVDLMEIENTFLNSEEYKSKAL